MVNHFFKNNLLTTKVGITHSLKNLIWWNNVDINIFFPKSFDLTDNEELEDFTNEYRFIKAESIVKKFIWQKGYINYIERLIVAIYVCEKRLKDIDEQLDDPNLELNVTENEWAVIGKEKVAQSVIDECKEQKWYKRIYPDYEDLLEDSESDGEESKNKNKKLIKYCKQLMRKFEEQFP